MGRLLLIKFIGNIRWIVACSLVTLRVLAVTYPPADTCQNPAPPVITGSAKFVCRNQPVTLTATGCTGTVVWSNGETGNSIQVQPQQTTKYTAICRAQPGCISCFADVWKITVNTPAPPVITASSKLVCVDDNVTLTATGCSGLVRWSDQTTGTLWTGQVKQTTSFQAICEQDNCVSNPSAIVPVQVATPTVPTISVSQSDICSGQSVQLTASGCIGTVRWTDGGEGLVRTATPGQTTTYKAVCQIGSCRSDSSSAMTVSVRSASQPLNLQTSLTNGCPFQTVDLSKAIIGSNVGLSSYYQFRTEPSLTSPAVQSPGAVLAGTYYIFGRDAQGCYTKPVAVRVNITPCANGIPPCLSNPPTVAIRLDSLDWGKGIVRMTAELGGSARKPDWQSSGDGLFTETGLTARYLLSETDRQRGQAIFTLKASDPDGNGPCVGALTQHSIRIPSPERIGLSKKVSEPIWLMDGGNQLAELTYQLTAVNFGTRSLKNLQLSDDLEAVFSSSGARIRSVSVRADSNLVVNPAYSGRGADTTLITGGNLSPGQQSRVWLTVRLDVSSATTLTFSNKAAVQAVDANGVICLDRSTNGPDADPDQNGNPADNDEPTSITLHSVRSEEGETVFIPEGFSPNGDGLNDRFVIQGVPRDLTIQLEVYNRWGQLVYQSTNYKNDWDGTPNQGVALAESRKGLPDGTYYYQIRLSDGREYVRFLMLVR